MEEMKLELDHKVYKKIGLAEENRNEIHENSNKGEGDNKKIMKLF